MTVYIYKQPTTDAPPPRRPILEGYSQRDRSKKERMFESFVRFITTSLRLVGQFMKLTITASRVVAIPGGGELTFCDYCSREATSLRSVWSAGERALVALCLYHSRRATPTSYGRYDETGLSGYWRED